MYMPNSAKRPLALKNITDKPNIFTKSDWTVKPK